ncbi:methyl-accepting chemotaxis protein [Xanthomonas albilineans]|uniref:methyl-accepting chemotaxis protein n=1 Tax=Xanthomonas albilineans TaxID=29447 RepID=UPI0005F34C6A|nr:methyl-accepting chemotaxis protein [Xanthomonas albilineans]PPU92146.1 methyl-accepting chemotaxis protein [Xanthomonas albilineans]
MALFSRNPDTDAAPAAGLPDAPIALLRLDPDGCVSAANRVALDLLGVQADTLLGASSEAVWGLPLAALVGSEGCWLAPGTDPSRRVRYQCDRDGQGWLLSLPHPETAALLRDVALLGGGQVQGAISPALQALAQRVLEGAAAQALLERVGECLTGCDLDLGLSTPLSVQDAEVVPGRRLAAGFGNLAEAIRQAVGLSLQIAADVPHVVAENDELARQSQTQLDALQTVVSTTRRLLQGLHEMDQELRAVIAVAASADDSARQGVEAARTLGQAMQEVARRSARANEVIQVIDSVAFQTNILSINASIEAVHAGPAGRGFAVVATEIRQLAERAANAARDVRIIIGETGTALQDSAVSAQRTEQVLGGIGELLGRASAAMDAVASRVAAQSGEIGGIDRAVEHLVGLSRSNLEHAASVVQRSEALGTSSATLHDCVNLFRLPDDPMRQPRHARVRDLATAAAAQVGQAFEAALARGRIAEDALFSTDYTPIQGVDPPKYRTAFDALCDELLPPLQEPLLSAHPWIVFAICANVDGYVPTHNLCFSQTLSGDRARDLVGNRTKRIFTDRVGRTVGRHTEPYLLQVYRRDTGQILFDLSVPVYARGRHWGGLRVAYVLE